MPSTGSGANMREVGSPTSLAGGLLFRSLFIIWQGALMLTSQALFDAHKWSLRKREESAFK